MAGSEASGDAAEQEHRRQLRSSTDYQQRTDPAFADAVGTPDNAGKGAEYVVQSPNDSEGQDWC